MPPLFCRLFEFYHKHPVLHQLNPKNRRYTNARCVLHKYKRHQALFVSDIRFFCHPFNHLGNTFPDSIFVLSKNVSTFLKMFQLEYNRRSVLKLWGYCVLLLIHISFILPSALYILLTQLFDNILKYIFDNILFDITICLTSFFFRAKIFSNKSLTIFCLITGV